MCVVSMIGDHYFYKWKDNTYYNTPLRTYGDVSRYEFEELKKEVLEMKELLKRAKLYDEENGEPDCEIDEKMKFLRKVSESVGIDLDDVLGEKNAS